MPKIFELFGYPITDNSKAAERTRREARCPFMGRDCDGGGNRYLSDVNLLAKPELRRLFVPERDSVRAGVCSIKLLPDAASPWIVCPRRLLTLGRERNEGENTYQAASEEYLLNLLGYPVGTHLGIWSEVKLAYRESIRGQIKKFDYTFDYVMMPLGRVGQTEAEQAATENWGILRRRLERNGYTIARRNNELFVEDFPAGRPSVIEIMTSSTSGGNKAHRTTIPAAFEDALLGREHKAPGINYRQVWARMVSQLIVKSEVGLSWGGKTIWIVQDVLVNYICTSTALDIRAFLADRTGEVNMLSLSYGDQGRSETGVIELETPALYAGPISSRQSGRKMRPSFQDMVRAPVTPPLSRLVRQLAGKRPVNRILV